MTNEPAFHTLPYYRATLEPEGGSHGEVIGDEQDDEPFDAEVFRSLRSS